MTTTTYPSQNSAYRKFDFAVHFIGLTLILIAGSALFFKALDVLSGALILSVMIYIACALVSNLASWAYHFLPWHDRRQFLRRIDHAAIYLSISGTFTPFFVQADTSWTWSLLWISWALTAVAVWKKITAENVKSKWSTASYLGLGAIGLCALPDLTNVPVQTGWCIIAGSVCYVIGTVFYARKNMPFRYGIWHSWVNFGGICMYFGIWLALF